MTLTPSNSLFATLQRFAERQSPEEIARQYSVVSRMETERRVLVVIAFLSAALFLPVWVCLGLLVVETASEVMGLALLKTVDPPHQPLRYLAMLSCYLLSQISYNLVPMLIWQLDNPLAKSYAVGTTLLTMVHLSTVRTVHLPMALVGAVTVIAASALANLWYWLAVGDLMGLALSSGLLAAGSYFSIITILSLHRLHGEMLQGRTAAQAADQAKSRFLAQMSHELRTPLNAILGMGNAELALSQTQDGRDRMTILVQSARGLAIMLDDILDLSAVQAGQLPIRPAALDLRAEIANTVALFRQQVEDAGLMLRFSLHDSVPQHARLDGQRLRQCLSNILSNAVKHTRAGLISVYAYEHQPGVLAIKVADNGPGVPEDLREKIFEPFYRGQLNVPGTGLGMAIGRTLARRMGGDLVLLPSVSGAHFLLTLGFEPATEQDIPVPKPDAAASLAGLVVLVVDDIATNRLVAATYLRLLGAEPVEVSAGADALARIAGPQPPHVVLLDLLMPGMDGLETLRQIRGLGGHGANIPVIAMSADSTERHRREANAAPHGRVGEDGQMRDSWRPDEATRADPNANGPQFDGFLDKPLSAEGLRRVLLPLASRVMTEQGEPAQT